MGIRSWAFAVFAVFGGAVFAGASAQAADKPEIAVVGIHDASLDDTAQDEAVHKLVTAIEATGKFTALTDEQFAQRIAGREQIILEDAFLGPGQRQFEDGRNLYEQAQPQDAIPVLEGAIDSMRTGMATANSGRDLWEAWVYLGTAYLSLDPPQTEDAHKAWASAVALSPTRNPSAAKFPPNVVEEFDALRKKVMTETSVITVVADQPDVTVYLNGEEKGKAPVVLQGVVPGENHITARGTGGSTGYQLVDVPPSGAETVSVKMGVPTLGSGGDTKIARQRLATSLYRSLGQRSGVDMLLLVGVADDRLYLQLYSVKADGFSQPLSDAAAGGAADQTVQAIPNLLQMIGADGSLPVSDTTANAIPIDVGANRLLAQMLLNPKAPQVAAPTTGPTKTGGGGGKWIAVGAGAGVLAAAGVTAAVLVGGGGGTVDPNQGTIIFEAP